MSERIKLEVYVDLDPIPGTFHSKESAQNILGTILMEWLWYYHPMVSQPAPVQDEIVYIYKQDPDDLNSIGRLVAVAENARASEQWIQDEVDGRHPARDSYASGHLAEWWIDKGYFRLVYGKIQREK